MTDRTNSDLTNYVIGGVLLVLTLLTYLAARIDLGAANLIIALLIAAAKAILILLFFMHARKSGGLTWVVIGAGLLWFGILLLLTMSDYVARYPAI